MFEQMEILTNDYSLPMLSANGSNTYIVIIVSVCIIFTFLVRIRRSISTPQNLSGRSGMMLLSSPTVANGLSKVIEKVKQQFDVPSIHATFEENISGTVGEGDSKLSLNFINPEAPIGSRESFIQNDRCWRIASVTKSFTATLLLQLVELGIVPPMDTAIDRWIPETQYYKTSKITLAMLANMTSGLADYEEIITGNYKNMLRSWTPEELIELSMNQPPLFEPGTAWHYSNSGYIILGVIMCYEAKEPSLDTLMQRYILKPFGLHHTKLIEGKEAIDGAIDDPHIKGYADIGDGNGVKDVTYQGVSWGWAAGSIISTSEDMHRWARIFGTGAAFDNHCTEMSSDKILASPSCSPLLSNSATRYFSPFKRTFFYGYALIQDNGWIYHNGDIPGWGTVVAYHPANQLSVVLVCNKTTSKELEKQFKHNSVNELLKRCVEVLTPEDVIH